MTARARRSANASRGRMVRVAVAIAAAGLCSGMPAYAQRTSDPEAAPPIDVAGPQLEDALAREMDRMRRAEERDNRPEAKQQRNDSRVRYGNASEASAFGLARREARLDEARPAEEPTNVEKYVGPDLALVKQADGSMGLVSSTLPLRDRDENGRTVPIDTDLKSNDGVLAPDNAVTDYEIGRDARDGVAFEDTGIKMRIAAADAGSSAVALDEKAFFADVRKDLDHMVVAQPMGVQTFQTVRSAAADEQYALRSACRMKGYVS